MVADEVKSSGGKVNIPATGCALCLIHVLNGTYAPHVLFIHPCSTSLGLPSIPKSAAPRGFQLNETKFTQNEVNMHPTYTSAPRSALCTEQNATMDGGGDYDGGGGGDYGHRYTRVVKT